MCFLRPWESKILSCVSIGVLSLGAATLPWLLSQTRFHVRIIVVTGFALTGACVWIAGVLRREKRPGWVLAGGAILSVAAASLWISLASYSGQLAKFPSGLIFGMTGSAVTMPLVVSFLFLKRTDRNLGKRFWFFFLPVALIVSLLYARPARRYRYHGHSSAVQNVASSLKDEREAVHWVHENIAYDQAPFTDTAEDTLSRGKARCGGMANVLHAIMRTMGTQSRIVHLESGSGIHTLVEYWNRLEERWILADPQHALLGDDWGSPSGLDLIAPGKNEELPEYWRGFTSLYIYNEHSGFVEAVPGHYSKSP